MVAIESSGGDMAKEVITTDRYQIHAETSLEQMGFVVAALTRMGLLNIGYELITDIHAYKKGAERKVHGVNALDFAKEWIKEHATFKASELVKACEGDGRSSGTAYGSLRDLVKAKVLRKLGPGNYQRTDVKALEAPAKPKSKRGTSNAPYDVPNKTVISKWVGNKSRFKLADLTAHFLSIGRNPKSVSPIVTKMMQAKFIKAVGFGEYVVKKKEIKVKNKLRKQRYRDNLKNQTALNGQQSSEATNG
jgi:hypothetical protein